MRGARTTAPARTGSASTPRACPPAWPPRSAPPDDPSFRRLEALAQEAGDPTEAHRCWRAYEQEIAADAQRWPGDVGRVARALVWHRMGVNAAAIPDAEQRRRLPPALLDAEA